MSLKQSLTYALLIVSIFPLYTFAATTTPKLDAKAQAKLTHEQCLETAKQNKERKKNVKYENNK